MPANKAMQTCPAAASEASNASVDALRHRGVRVDWLVALTGNVQLLVKPAIEGRRRQVGSFNNPSKVGDLERKALSSCHVDLEGAHTGDYR